MISFQNFKCKNDKFFCKGRKNFLTWLTHVIPETSDIPQDIFHIRDRIHDDQQITIHKISAVTSVNYGSVQPIIKKELKVTQHLWKMGAKSLNANDKCVRGEIFQRLLWSLCSKKTLIVVNSYVWWIIGTSLFSWNQGVVYGVACKRLKLQWRKNTFVCWQRSHNCLLGCYMYYLEKEQWMQHTTLNCWARYREAYWSQMARFWSTASFFMITQPSRTGITSLDRFWPSP